MRRKATSLRRIYPFAFCRSCTSWTKQLSDNHVPLPKQVHPGEPARPTLFSAVTTATSAPTDKDLPPPRARTLWQRRVRDPIVNQLTQGISPEKIALTLAVGSGCAVFPILGTTTALCFLAGIMLRLNQPIIQLINQLLWPVQIAAILVCIKLGELIVRAPGVSFNLADMHRLFWDSPARFFDQYGATVLHAIIGWLVVAPLGMAALYLLTLPLLRSVNRLRSRSTIKPAI